MIVNSTTLTFTKAVQEFEYRYSNKSRSGLAGIEFENRVRESRRKHRESRRTHRESRRSHRESSLDSRLDSRFPIHARIENRVSTYF